MVSLSRIPQSSEGNGQIIQIIKPNNPNNVCLTTRLSAVKERSAIYKSLATGSQGEIS